MRRSMITLATIVGVAAGVVSRDTDGDGAAIGHAGLSAESSDVLLSEFDIETLRREGAKLGSRADGNPNADVFVFGDFECSGCRRFAEGPLMDLRQRVQQQVNVFVLPFPLAIHRSARSLAIAGECALGQGRFRELHDWIYGSEAQQLAAIHDSIPYQTLGIDPERQKACMDDPQTTSILERKIELAERLGVRVTPTVIVDGVWLSEVPTSADLVQRVGVR